jgi:D-arabinose 1-dehydrogenase-like Zn-dependent alcohol dehydrogenase
MTGRTRAMQARSVGEPLEAVDVPVERPARGWVGVEVYASGVCHADLRAARPDHLEHPVTPGHEVAGRISVLGEGVVGWQVGERVSVGWFGGSCGRCELCRRGDVVHCAERQTPGVSYPGGWAQSLAAPVAALARIPDGMSDIDAAPMGCAGVTMFTALRDARLAPGARVTIFGLGGLGHLGVQFAEKLGHEVTVIARGLQREPLARRLGAHHYIDSNAADAGAELARRGGADLIVCAASTTAPVPGLTAGLRPRGRLTLVGVDASSVEIPVARMVAHAQIVAGHLTGNPADTEEAMRFAHRTGVHPVVETAPLETVNDALDRLARGAVRFRTVLTPEAAS